MAGYAYRCRMCGAPLEVRVAFKGYIVWPVDAQHSDFGSAEPELRGDNRDPEIICTADALHTTGFKLEEGEIVAAPLGTG